MAYKDGKKWAESSVKTTDSAIELLASSDREIIKADGKDLAFITVRVVDKDGFVVPRSNNQIDFSIDGPGEIIATDNGDATNMVSFTSKKREAFNGLCLVIIRTKPDEKGIISITAKSNGLKDTLIKLHSN